MNFGCVRFVYNKMLEERKDIFRKYKNDKQALRDYTYKTEKQLKTDYPFLKEADSNSLQQSRRNLEKAFNNFFENLKERKAGKTTRRVGYRIRLLEDQNITIIHDEKSTVGTAGIHAFGDYVRPHLVEAMIEELGISPF